MNFKLKPILLILVGFTLLLAACAAPIPEPTAAPAEEPANSPATIPAVTDISPTGTALPASTDAPAATAAVSFAKEVLPILESRCLNCHGGQETRAGLSVASHAALMNGSESGPAIIPGDAANSLLVQLIENGKMPKRGPKLTPDQIQIIIDWILSGAPNN